MRDSSLLEVLKLSASIATPVVIAIFGIIINKTIQRQNAIVQRESSWHTRWADDFLKAASRFNKSAKKFMWVYITAEWNADGNANVSGAKDLSKGFQDEALPHLRDLNKGWVEISLFSRFAQHHGKALMTTASALLSEAKSWHDKGESNFHVFLQKQVMFNENVWEVHAELLGLQDLKD